MKRKILIGLLALGTIGGYGWGIVRLVRVRADHRGRFEEHVERVCERGARRALGTERPDPRAFGPWHGHGRGAHDQPVPR